MDYKIWLDDVRKAPGPGWLVCRSVAEAQEVMYEFGWPQFISFDHDLGKDEPSGYDFAHWIIEWDLNHGSMPKDFDFAVHSMNPVGAENIGRLMMNYLKHKETFNG